MDFTKTLKTIGKLLSPLKKSIIPLILIVAFLLIDVYCNLTLPKYTADIVDDDGYGISWGFGHNRTLILLKQSVSSLWKGFKKNKL